MKHVYRLSIVAAVAAATACAAHAGNGGIVIDGTADAGYGPALATQDTNTQFGNAMDGDPINGGGGSEIDQAFGRIENGRLYLLFAGNLETNFNKLEIFIDSEAGGVNSIVGDELPGGVDSFCCGGFPPPDGSNTDNVGALQRMNGLTFDTGFDADHLIVVTHGFENALSPQINFYASSVHYADLTEGTSGRTAALGMQLAHRGLPNVLRGTTGDTDTDGTVDGGEFLVWGRNVNQFDGVNAFAERSDGDSSGDQLVNGTDLGIWQATFAFDVMTTGFDGPLFAPLNGAVDNSDILLGPALPNLNQGDLIDRAYTLSDGGATDDSGAGAITPEIVFSLGVDPADTGNTFSHRNMDNIVDLQLAIDNSNTEGVSGDSPYTNPTTGNPGDVTTGVELSIPLSEIGNPTGDIRIFAFVNGGGHDFASNQFIGEAGILDGNLGGNGFGGFTGDLAGVDMNDFAGAQFFTVSLPPPPVSAVPEPAAICLIGIGVAGLAAGRRK